MSKVWTIAWTEFNNAVRTKAFILGILMLPIIYGLAFVLQVYASKADTRPRPFAVIDRSGAFYESIARAAEQHNKDVLGPDGKPKESLYLPRKAEGTADAAAAATAEAIRRGELFALLDLPESLALTTPKGVIQMPSYYSNNPNDQNLRRWLDSVVGAEVRGRRTKAAGVDPAMVAFLNTSISSENLSLGAKPAAAAEPTATTAASGQPAAAKPARIAAQKVDPVRTFGVPFALLMIIFMIVMGTAPQLLNSVLEEKMSRISEVLLGSVTPFELMFGKLLGASAVALLVGLLYLGVGYGVAVRYGYGDAVTPRVLMLLALFIPLAIVMFGAMYMAVGAACSEIKDAQSLMMPVMLVSMMPMFVVSAVIVRPDSPLSVGLSLFPTATPFLMLVRMTLQPEPPLWQLLLSIVLTVATAIALVYAAGKILRVGLLMQGKPPTYRDLARWVMAK